jgi:hypothetical protein
VFLDRVYAAPEPERITQCDQIVSQSLELLAEAYPNVYTRDLSRYAPVTDAGEIAFYDLGHLKPLGSQRVIDALLPEIRSAMQWADAARSDTGPEVPEVNRVILGDR